MAAAVPAQAAAAQQRAAAAAAVRIIKLASTGWSLAYRVWRILVCYFVHRLPTLQQDVLTMTGEDDRSY